MKKARCLIPLLMVVTIIFSFNCAGTKSLVGPKGYVLEYRMDEGVKFSITGSSSVESITDQMGTEVVSEINSKGENVYTVLSSGDDTGLTVELEFGERAQEAESPMGSASTDFSEIVGKKVKFTITPTGEVNGFEGFDDLPEITSVDGAKLNQEMQKLGVKASFFKLPDKPIKIGESWSEEQDLDIPLGESTLKSESKTTYTFTEVAEWEGEACLKIAVSGSQILTGEFEQGGQPLSLERETKTEGTIYFAYKRGMFLHMETDSEAEGIITVVGAGIEIPQQMTTKASVNVEFGQ